LFKIEAIALVYNSTVMFCQNTQLAVIYADLPAEKTKPGADTLANDIRRLEKTIWDYKAQKYLGIFSLQDAKVAPPFAEFAAFHASTETGCVMDEPGTFSPTLQERLRSTGTTHILFVGFEVAVAALEAKKQGFQVCVFQPATRSVSPESLEEMKTAGVVVAENEGQVLADFISRMLVIGTCVWCPHCEWPSGIPRWCIHQMGEFLWFALLRLRMAQNAVIAAGFHGPVDPMTYSMNREIKQRPKGYWLCSYKEKREFEEALDMAGTAGIPLGNSIYIAGFLPPFTEGRCEVEELKEEIAFLKAQLAAKEAKAKDEF
jgi:hypothetical protein